MMTKIIHNLTQGSPEWHAFRSAHFGASEAAAMLGLSKYVTRAELLRQKALGTEKEISRSLQMVFDRGHETEALARPIAEELVGEELYPATVSDGNLSVSCDGLTMAEDVAFEHKQFNAELFASVKQEVLPEEHWPQCQQALLVTGAERLLFVCSDGTRNMFAAMWVYPNKPLQKQIVDGWAQFAQDLAAYQHVEVLPAAVAEPTLALPAVSVQVNGSLSVISNLDLFGAKLADFIQGINLEPKDDQAFADAEAAIKTLEKAQEALEQAESAAMAQVATVDEMRRTVALYVEQARKTRLMLEKLVKARKEQIRGEILQSGKDALAAHLANLNKRLNGNYMPAVSADFAGVMKGKKSIQSLRDAVDTELAQTKIGANAIADSIQINLNAYAELAKEKQFLFPDLASLVLKLSDDFIAAVKLRISEHDAAEEKRMAAERERIAAEERAKLEVQAKPVEPVRNLTAEYMRDNPPPSPNRAEVVTLAIRDRIDGALDRMNESDLRKVWSYIERDLRLTA